MRININNSNDKYYRYKMDSVVIENIGNKKGSYTKIKNMKDICNELGHPKEVLLKYISLYFSTSSSEKKESINGVFTEKQIQEAIYSYINNFVMCSKCKIPEVIPHIEGTKKNKTLHLKCNACGHIHIVNSSIKNINKGKDIIIKYMTNNKWKIKKGMIVTNSFDPFNNILDF